MTDFHHFDLKFLCHNCVGDRKNLLEGLDLTNNCDSEENIKCIDLHLNNPLFDRAIISCEVRTFSNIVSTEPFEISECFSSVVALLQALKLLFKT
ncbi:unnamed protein product [Auanema sp. JU1783]|nr:unnamed protein product [Auanema sp. JU1783]